MFEPAGGHGHGPHEPISIAMGGGPFAEVAADGSPAPRRHPDWIKARIPSGENYHDLKRLLRGLELNTVCEEARCPNIGECWDQRTATIMILGDTCTRACGFCAVKTGRPTWNDEDEPRRVAEAIGAARPRARRRDERRPRRPARRRRPHLRRDDPPPPGELAAPRHRGPHPRLQRRARRRCGRSWTPGRTSSTTTSRPSSASRSRSASGPAGIARLGVLARAKADAAEIGYTVHTKSSLMVGLGETRDELTAAFRALREVDCDILTIGQYLRPSERHLPLIRYYHPDEFTDMKVEALALGFRHVESGPLVRSSYHARDQVPGAELRRLRRRATLDADGRVVPAAS